MTTNHIDCPHPDCDADLKVPDSAPAGVYDCICKACKVRLTWAYYLDRGRVPHLSLEPKEEASQ